MFSKLHKNLVPTNKIVTLLSLFAVTLLSNCTDSNSTLSIPDAYDASTFTTASSIELSVLDKLDNLVTEMKKGRSVANVVEKTVLENLYETGSPSLSDITTTYYDSKIKGNAGFLANVATASGNEFNPSSLNETGGVYGSYLFSQYGLESEQQIEKGLFAAALYNHFLTLSKSEISANTVQQLLAITGANPSFPSSNNASLHENPDRFAAVYMARRDKNDGNGFYSRLKKEFLRLQAAVNQGAEFNDDRNETIQEIKLIWEKATFATVINYSYSTINTLSSTNPTDAQKSSALHACSEAVGFLHGFKTIPETDKVITDTQIEELLMLINAPSSGNASPYLFVTDSANQLPKLLDLISKIQAIYGFTNAEMEDFKKNWINEQSR